MSATTIMAGCPIFDGQTFHDNAAIVVRDGVVQEITDQAGLDGSDEIVALDGGVLAPGFVDLQVNGGGGLLFNDDPSVATIEAICAAHARLGTTALLATLITDTPEKTRAAIDAAVEAQRRQVPGFLGLHLEGPHLSQARKGAHDAALIRAMSEDDLQLLLNAARNLLNLMITVAPETVTNQQIAALSSAGAAVSLGHSDCGFDTATAAAEAGARCVTHLFNAMSPIGHREPGMVGAALQSGGLYAGLIADGYHVHPAAIRIALAAKAGPGEIFLVSDAMSVAGSDLRSFTLGGRKILRQGGRLTLEDGTLAGADLDLGRAVRLMAQNIGVELDRALKMASAYPADCIGASPGYGYLQPGSRADLVHLDSDLKVDRVWLAGKDAG